MSPRPRRRFWLPAMGARGKLRGCAPGLQRCSATAPVPYPTIIRSSPAPHLPEEHRDAVPGAGPDGVQVSAAQDDIMGVTGALLVPERHRETTGASSCVLRTGARMPVGAKHRACAMLRPNGDSGGRHAVGGSRRGAAHQTTTGKDFGYTCKRRCHVQALLLSNGQGHLLAHRGASPWDEVTFSLNR